jgi:N-acetylneuraminic acid mutarotase
MRTLGLLLSLAFLLAGCGDDDGDTADMAIDIDAAVDGGPACEPTGMVPTSRGEHGAVLDADRGRILVYGGNLAFPVECMPRVEITDEIWAFDLACQSWTQLTSTGGPGLRARMGMVPAADGQSAYLFGGRRQASSGYENFADVWQLDFATLEWTEIATTGEAPTPRSHPAIAHDAGRDRLIVFGGNTSTSGLSIVGTDDTWALDLTSGAWTRLAEDTAPPPRYAHGFAHRGDTFYVFGGSPDFDGPFTNDVWALDLTTDSWSQIAGGGPDSPIGRFGSGLFATDTQLVMVAGHDSAALGNVNDIWTVDLATGAWTEVVRGDELNNPDVGFCEFPADFTTPDTDAPERRHYFGTVQHEGTGYVVMGKTDCGNANDVWAVDLASPSWELFGQASTSGEACNRSGATACTELCF